MAQSGQRKCLCCGEFFDVDHCNRNRQRYCSTTPCRRASKAASQADWLTQPMPIRLTPKDTIGGSFTRRQTLPVVAAPSFWALTG